jgi:ribose transport system ATP-binding protein
MHGAVVMKPLLQLERIGKVYPNGTMALRAVDLAVQSGTVHGLLGANGAGKSTLIKILSGAVSASAGQIYWRGEAVQWRRPSQPKAAGVASLHQHIPLVGTLSVLENVFLGERSKWRRASAQRTRLRGLLDSIGYDIDVDALAGDLPIGQRQMVAILQALAANAQLIVMDEPTASLANEEREIVYRTIRHLTRAEGKAVIFVSHFLDEIMALTDEVTVLRDGVAVLRAPTSDLSEPKIAAAMVGREIAALTRRATQSVNGPSAALSPHTSASASGPAALRSPTSTLPESRSAALLETIRLSSPRKLAPCSLQLHVGEVLGIAGFLGSGRSELLHAIFGSDREARGDVLVAGQKIARKPAAAVQAGIALVPEDRMKQGLVPIFSLWQNTTLPSLEQISRRGALLNRRRERECGEQAIRRLGIKAADVDVPVSDLSGGNAQKVSIAKWLFGGAKVFLLDEPTAGIDVGAKADILQLISDLAAGLADGKARAGDATGATRASVASAERDGTQGAVDRSDAPHTAAAVIIVSSEFEELLVVCDRILVMREGTIVAERRAVETTEQELILLAGASAASISSPATNAQRESRPS